MKKLENPEIRDWQEDIEPINEEDAGLKSKHKNLFTLLFNISKFEAKQFLIVATIVLIIVALFIFKAYKTPEKFVSFDETLEYTATVTSTGTVKIDKETRLKIKTKEYNDLVMYNVENYLSPEKIQTIKEGDKITFKIVKSEKEFLNTTAEELSVKVVSLKNGDNDLVTPFKYNLGVALYNMKPYWKFIPVIIILALTYFMLIKRLLTDEKI